MMTPICKHKRGHFVQFFIIMRVWSILFRIGLGLFLFFSNTYLIWIQSLEYSVRWRSIQNFCLVHMGVTQIAPNNIFMLFSIYVPKFVTQFLNFCHMICFANYSLCCFQSSHASSHLSNLSKIITTKCILVH
jgi:hypothetical protein